MMAQKQSRPKVDKREFAARLSQVMAERGLTNSDMIKKLTARGEKVTKAQYSRWVNGGTAPGSTALRANLAKELKISFKWLYFGEGSKQSPDDLLGHWPVPLIEEDEIMSLDRALARAQQLGATFTCQNPYSEKAFAVAVKDRANIPWLLPVGHERGSDVVVVDPAAPLKPEAFVYIEVREGNRYRRSFREYHPAGGGKARLVALNSAYETLTIDDTKLTHIRIIGPVCEARRTK